MVIETTPTATDSRIHPDLPSLIRAHASTFPWYAELLRASGAGDTSALHELPVIDEHRLAKHYYIGARPALPDASAYHTSGTTGGERKRILYSPADDDRYIAHRRVLFERFLRDVPPGSTAVADLGTGHAAASARRIFVELGFDAHDIDFASPVAEHVALLNQWQPDVLFTMPMILDRILAAPDPLQIRPRRIIVVGDVAPAEWRRYIAEHFGIAFEDMLDVVGSIEIGAIAYYCADTGLYHFHDHILPEVVAPQDLYADYEADRVDDAAGRGILLLTSFAREYFPALRFATNDVITGLRTIEWGGSTVHAFDRVEGRFGGEVKHGERISHHDLCAAVNDVLPGALFEVVNDGLLEVRIASDTVDDAQLDALRARLRAANPDVAQMIASGLVDDIVVRRIGSDQLTPRGAKRSFALKGAG